jgi:hypothetical protein
VTDPERSAVAGASWRAAAVILAAVAPYLSTLHDYYLQEDFGNVQYFAAKPWLRFVHWFTMPWTEDLWGFVPDEIRPFTGLAFQLSVIGGAEHPELGHVMNYVLHAANALLVLELATTVAGLRPVAALFTALVFAVLPAQAESVVWITGRVDSLPAFFYLATFAAYARWRVGGAVSHRMYAISLVLFFVALFTKQTTITMCATLVFYDWLIADRPPRPSWRWVAPYVPFAVMTIGYLALRYVVVGTVVRESRLTLQGLAFFAELFARHLRRVVTGTPGPLDAFAWAAAVGGSLAIVVAAFYPGSPGRRRLSKTALCMGPLWWLVGIAPVLVAGYDSPRHAYVASIGWAMLLGVGVGAALEPGRRRVIRRTAGAAAAAAVAVYFALLQPVLLEWRTAAAISKQAVVRLEREALAAPAGTLLMVGAPIRLWEWGIPFLARPPFTATDLTARVHLLAPQRLHCCLAPWYEETKTMLRNWLALPTKPPIVAIYVDAGGAISRVTDAERPELRTIVPALVATDSAETLDRAIVDTLRTLVRQP